MWIGEADLYRCLSARKNERLAEGPRHSLESYCSQEHDAAFDALPDALEFGEACLPAAPWVASLSTWNILLFE